VFAKRSHDRRLVAGLFVLLTASALVLLRLEVGARLLAIGGRPGKLERMV
jgi:hypothetical protein